MTRLETTTSYFLPSSYQSRLDNDFFDDTPLKDEFQKEVYEHARMIADRHELDRVTDIGCGSAYKLLKNFYEFETVGVDLPSTIAWLRTVYPARGWYDSNFAVPLPHSDLVICADVIEHVVDPDKLLRYIKEMQPVRFVLSTPERLMLKELQAEWREDGPPVNPAHVREWSFDEFEAYIGSWFKIEEHFISNESQGTQCVVCSLAS